MCDESFCGPTGATAWGVSHDATRVGHLCFMKTTSINKKIHKTEKKTFILMNLKMLVKREVSCLPSWPIFSKKVTKMMADKIEILHPWCTTDESNYEMGNVSVKLFLNNSILLPTKQSNNQLGAWWYLEEYQANRSTNWNLQTECRVEPNKRHKFNKGKSIICIKQLI